jgi:hypothetical protein
MDRYAPTSSGSKTRWTSGWAVRAGYHPRFIGGGIVSGSNAAALLKGISGGRTATGCPLQHPEFALISATGGQLNVAIEIGGCDQVITTIPTHNTVKVGQATSQAVALIKTIATPQE